MVGYDGVTRAIWERGRPWHRADGRLMIDGFALDVTEQKRAERELQLVLERLEVARAVADRRSRMDGLTGVYNRSHLSEVIEVELERAVREGTTPGFFLIDLDHFKRVNDTYGHLSGDAVLVQAAARIRRSVRPYDCVARWGGEEFAVVVPVVTSDEALRSIGEGLRRAIAAEPFEADGALLSLTASVGCVRAGRERWTAESLVRGRRPGPLRRQGGRPQPHPQRARRAVGGARHRRCRDRDDRECACAGGRDPRRPAARRAPTRPPSWRGWRPPRWASICAAPVVPAWPRCSPTPARLRSTTTSGPRSRPTAWRWRITRWRSRTSSGASPASRNVAAVLRHQHERFDGSGVPDALAGADIAIEARIVAAAVVLAAAGDPDMLEPLAGGVLDPAVVEALRIAVGR